MSAFIGPQSLAPAGSTGNNTHTSVKLAPAANKIAGVLIVEAVGATPTVTAKLQGTLDPDTTPDGSALWFDLWATPAGAAAEVANQVQTAVGAFPVFVNAPVKFARRVRLVTSLNTNVTYRGELSQQYGN